MNHSLRDGDLVADYVIVGAGSAGSVLADRLSECGRYRVAVIEAGPLDRNPFIHIPAGFLNLIDNPRVDWRMQSVAVPSLDGRTINYPQGKVAGGTGSINGMLYVRTHRTEHEAWVQAGCRGWSYEECLPAYAKAETGEGAPSGRPGIDVQPFLEAHGLAHRFLAAAAEVGLPTLQSLNGFDRDGAAFFHQTRRGRFRGGPGQTYLRRARRRGNVTLLTDALCRRVLFEGRVAIGVEYSRGGEVRRVLARREVIVANGALRSPQLLQISGVGPADLVRSLGVPVVADRPAVGTNLRDHFSVRLPYRISGIVTLNERTRGWRLGRELARYVLGYGLLTLGASNAAAFARSREGLAGPDLQLSFAPASFQAGRMALERESGMTIAVFPSYPESTGTVRARASDSAIPPDIQPNYLATRGDQETTLAGVRLARRVLASPQFAPFNPSEMRPGSEILSDADLLEFARREGVPGSHHVGTCRMGGSPESVLAPDLTVREVDRLRVIDASALPSCTLGNSNAPTIMLAERGANFILGK